jgi:hypothetical protein
MVQVHPDGEPRGRVELQQHAGLAARRLGAADLEDEPLIDQAPDDG